ncbi:MAG: hypothetical protein HRT88_13645, partial [Lentisphaeraceae bacterium]|nr:hypothetical protein [Lentisphaeraceae bacterium]
MNWRLIILLYKKELLEFVRDRRTFMIMLLVPALLYPGMIIVTTELASKQAEEQAKQIYNIAVKEGFSDTALVQKISTHEKIKLITLKKADFTKSDLFIEPSDNFTDQLNQFASADLKISYKTAEDSSRFAYNKVNDIIYDYEKNLIAERLAKEKLPKTFTNPIQVEVIKIDK